MTVQSAIRRALFLINFPSFCLFFGIPALAIYLVFSWQLTPSIYYILGSIPLGFLVAWLWWAWTLPKWRLWAITQVDDLGHLYSRAINMGIMWPRGHFFEKTEIKSKSHAIKEREIELSYFLDSVKAQLAKDPMIADAAKEFQRVFANGGDLPEKAVAATSLKNVIGLSNYADTRMGGDIDEAADVQRDVFAILLEEYCKLLEK